MRYFARQRDILSHDGRNNLVPNKLYISRGDTSLLRHPAAPPVTTRGSAIFKSRVDMALQKMHSRSCLETASSRAAESMRGPSGVHPASIWGPSGVHPRSIPGPSGSTRGHFGVVPGSIWGPSGINFWVVPGSIWGRPKVHLGSSRS